MYRKLYQLTLVFSISLLLLMVSNGSILVANTNQNKSNMPPHDHSSSTKSLIETSTLSNNPEPSPFSPFAEWSSQDNDNTRSIAWGDVDGDGDLDLAIGNASEDRAQANKLYLNENGILQTKAQWISVDLSNTFSVAWGDVDKDGDLDLAVGNYEQENGIYINNNGILSNNLTMKSSDLDKTRSISWGDVDGDGDLDLAVGNYGQTNKIYLNENGILQTNPIWHSSDISNTRSVAWGDIDNDGDLDLAVGNYEQQNGVYINEGGSLSQNIIWVSENENNTTSIAWGDVNNDGYFDLAIGNYEQANYVHINNAGNLSVSANWASPDSNSATTSVAWGDADGDGDLDLAVSNTTGALNQSNKIYFSEQGQLSTTTVWSSSSSAYGESVAWGDFDGDGDLDLALGSLARNNEIYINKNGIMQVTSNWGSNLSLRTRSLDWGDINNDGHLDLIAGNLGEPNRVYLSHAGELSEIPDWESIENESTQSIALGDINHDGYLDLAVGNLSHTNKIYLNNKAGGFETVPYWESSTISETYDVAWGDINDDGYLDLVVGNYRQPNQVFLNEGTMLSQSANWESEEAMATRDLVLGDLNEDGYLDLIVANSRGESNQIYLNEGARLSLSSSWESQDSDITNSVALGDIDQDGDLDVIVGNFEAENKAYENINGNLQTNPNYLWTSQDIDPTNSIAVGDIDGDGDLDIAVGNGGSANKIYLNQNNVIQTASDNPWMANLSESTTSIALGDIDNDGDHDFAVGNSTESNNIYLSGSAGQQGLTNGQHTIKAFRPITAPVANHYVPSQLVTESIIPISYTLFHDQGVPAGQIQAEYSLNGGGEWFPAIATSSTLTVNLAASAYPTGTSHVYYWNTFSSNFFGESNNVIFRILALPQQTEEAPNTVYEYLNRTPFPIQKPYASAATFPFRVRGTQIRVYTDSIASGYELADAIVFRLSEADGNKAQWIGDVSMPFETTEDGYLIGRGTLALGDELVAMSFVTTTYGNIDIYHTSSTPTESGLNMHTVEKSGVQDLVVSSENTLALVNLVISLEWDARNDSTYTSQLEADLQRTSEILFDLTNGQVALGKIHVFHDKGFWNIADITISANNRQRPSAILGGNAITITQDISGTAYMPGQIRMGPTWNRFGNPGGVLGEDWPRALAHELGHYVFFVPDNYLGINENDQIILIDCPGSVMANPYNEEYSEFQTEPCKDSIAEQFFPNRSDWDFLQIFHPYLSETNQLTGPVSLPVNVTDITFFEPATATQVIDAPIFNLVNEWGQTITPRQGRTNGYLIKTGNTEESQDDYIIGLGSSVGGLIQARGAESGDRLCLYDSGHTPIRIGCNRVGNTAGSLTLIETPNWEPKVEVRLITSSTAMITVTNINESSLYGQIYPDIGMASAATELNPAGDKFVGTISLEGGAYFGYIRIWVPDTAKEFLIDYIAIQAWETPNHPWGEPSYSWGPPRYSWGPPRYSWGGLLNAWGPPRYSWGPPRYSWGVASNVWGAPIMSNDGYVSILPLNELFTVGSKFTLQTQPITPDLYPWLTSVGQAYEVSVSTADTYTATILFSYLANQVPLGYEDNLNIYYQAKGASSWELVSQSVLNTEQNQVSAQFQGAGIYILAATIEYGTFTEGWNNFGYPNIESQLVTEALGSIEGQYSIVYHFDSHDQEWVFYANQVDPEFDSFVNGDLLTLEPLNGYLLYATETATLYLGIEANQRQKNNMVEMPPAVYYGTVGSSADLTIHENSSLKAYVDNLLCGETTVQYLNDDAVYVLQVTANNLSSNLNSCGSEGAIIRFTINDQAIDLSTTWDNTQANRFDLRIQKDNNEEVFLPFLQR